MLALLAEHANKIFLWIFFFFRAQSTDKPFPSAVRGCAEFGSLDSSCRRRMFDYHTCSVMQMVGLSVFFIDQN